MFKSTALKFNNVMEYPWWGYALGWWFTLSSTLLVPLWMVYKLSTTAGTLRQVSPGPVLVQTLLHCFIPLFKSTSSSVEALHPVYTGQRSWI